MLKRKAMQVTGGACVSMWGRGGRGGGAEGGGGPGGGGGGRI